jgi:hypothetical protein
MKFTYKLPALLMLVLLAFTSFQCSKEQKSEAGSAIISAQQLAADPSFVEMVKTKLTIEGILYRKLRAAHSDEVRRQQIEAIAVLLKQPTQASVLSAVQKMGFENATQFVELTSGLMKKSYEVQQRFKGYNKLLTTAQLAEAYQLSVPLQGLMYTSYLVQEETRWGKKTAAGRTADYGQGQFCPDCHYNNCDECDGGGGGGGGGSNPACGQCLSEYDARTTRISQQLYDDIVDGCGYYLFVPDVDNFLRSCFGSANNPNPSQACQEAACAANAYYAYIARIHANEVDLGQCYTANRCN